MEEEILTGVVEVPRTFAKYKMLSLLWRKCKLSITLILYHKIVYNILVLLLRHNYFLKWMKIFFSNNSDVEKIRCLQNEKISLTWSPFILHPTSGIDWKRQYIFSDKFRLYKHCFRCNLKQKCSIMAASVSTFGDECPNIRKYLEVIYKCVKSKLNYKRFILVYDKKIQITNGSIK